MSACMLRVAPQNRFEAKDQYMYVQVYIYIYYMYNAVNVAIILFGLKSS